MKSFNQFFLKRKHIKRNETMIQGSIVAIVTPMHEDGSLDLVAYRRLIDWHIAEGTAAIVAVGTTGESPTVDFDEHVELLRVAVEHCAGRVPVIAGAGGNSTREAVELSQQALRLGARASLQVVPYYNKPTQEGLYRHFMTVADSCPLPVMLYNIPGRCGVAIFGLMLAAVFLAVATQVESARVASIVLAGGAGAIYLAQSAFWAVTADIADRSAGTVSGLMNMGGQIGGAVTASLTPWIA
jgi:4-hydroxy-tetrahydrodipicolinate synthase